VKYSIIVDTKSHQLDVAIGIEGPGQEAVTVWRSLTDDFDCADWTGANGHVDMMHEKMIAGKGLVDVRAPHRDRRLTYDVSLGDPVADNPEQRCMQAHEHDLRRHMSYDVQRGPLPELLGEPDKNSFGPSDVAEPICILVPDHLVDELGAALAQPRERIVDVLYGEHDA
jgi:hypothetical protein